ncbi:MAG: ATP/GTP-binding protein [Limisphaerales bacterium]
MAMWDAVDIVQFRHLQGLKLEGLRPINLLVGPNNSGKTSVLEALAILSHPFDLKTWLNVGRRREIKSARTPPDEVLKHLFPQQEFAGPGWQPFRGKVELRSEEDGESKTIEATLNEERAEQDVPTTSGRPLGLLEEGDKPAAVARFQVTSRDGREFKQWTLQQGNSSSVSPERGLTERGRRCRSEFVTTATHRTDHKMLKALSRLVDGNAKEALVRLLRALDPRIEDLKNVSPIGRSAMVKVRRRGVGYVPLSLEGDGIRRAVALASVMFDVQGGVVLVDEIEMGIHAAALGQVLTMIIALIRMTNAQVFATSHSLEALDAVVGAENFLGSSYAEAAVYQLPPIGSTTGVKRYSAAEALAIRTEDGFDLR